MDNWRRRWGQCLIVVLVVLVGACGGDSESGPTSESEELQEITLLLPFTEGSGYYPTSIARHQGYFEEEGLSVTIQPTDGSDFVVQQLLSGNQDFGLATAASDIIAFNQDPTFRVPSCWAQQLIFRLVVLEGSEIDEISELDGKTLGVNEIGGGEVPFAEASMRDAGLTPTEDVKFLPIGAGGAQTRRAIETGTVDAYMGSYVDIGLLIASGMQLEDITPDKYAAIPGSCFATRQSVLDDPVKRRAFIGVARAFTKGALFGVTNPEAALDIVCDDLPETCQDRDLELIFLKETARLAVPVDPSIPVGGIDQTGWETAAQVFFESGTIDEMVDVDDLLNSEDARAVREKILDFDAEAVEQAAQEYESD